MLTKDDLTPELLQKEFDSGLWHIEIGEKYHVSSRTIYDYVKKWNLNVPRKNKKKEVIKFVCKNCGKEFTKLEPEGICWNCKQKRDALVNQVPIENNSNSKYLTDVLKLRAEGLSYKKIAEKLGCSTSTISYLLSDKTREKRKVRLEKYKDNWYFYLKRRLSDFRTRTSGNNATIKCINWKIKLQKGIQRFKNRNNIMPTTNFTYKDVLDKFGTVVQCELTGRTIDLTKDDYNIDHIIPVSKGGTNNLDNLAFTTPEANAAKNGLTNEEFVALCKEVCEHFGYTVVKN